MNLGRLLLLAAVIGVFSAMSCAPVEVVESLGDNLSCHPDGYDERVVRGKVRTSFDFSGGACTCWCPGAPVALICTVTSTTTEDES